MSPTQLGERLGGGRSVSRGRNPLLEPRMGCERQFPQTFAGLSNLDTKCRARKTEKGSRE